MKTQKYKTKKRKTRRGGETAPATEPGFLDKLFGSKPEVSGVNIKTNAEIKTDVSIKTEVYTLIDNLRVLLKTKGIELKDDMTIAFIKQKST